MSYCFRLLFYCGTVSLFCLLSFSYVLAESDFPSEAVTPDWLIENTMAEGFWGAKNMTLENGSVYLSAPSSMQANLPKLTVQKMTLKNGSITQEWVDAMDKPGMYIGGTSSELNTGLRFFVCRVCELKDNESGESFKHDGLVFGKQDFTITDLYSIPHPMHTQQPLYAFSDEDTLAVSIISTGGMEYTKLSYLKQLGYSAYLDLPVKTVLRDKAVAGDTKAQFIYAMYWFDNAVYDPNGLGMERLDSIIKQADKNNPDVLMFFASLFEVEDAEKAIKLYSEASIARPVAKGLVANLLMRGSQPDMKVVCQLFAESAKLGSLDGQQGYSYCLHHGEGGIKKNQKLAHAYIALAAVNGHPQLARHLVDCGVGMPEVKQGHLIFKPCL